MPDSNFSLEPDEFTKLTCKCKEAWTSLEKIDYSLKVAERANYKFRRQIYFVIDLKNGSVISKNDVRIIRPGFGLPLVEIENLAGKELSINAARSTPIKWNNFINPDLAQKINQSS